MGGYDQLEELLTERNPDEVIVAMAPEEYALTGKVINICEKTGTKISLVPFYAKYMPSNPQVDNIDGLPMINLRRIPLGQTWPMLLPSGPWMWWGHWC